MYRARENRVKPHLGGWLVAVALCVAASGSSGTSSQAHGSRPPDQPGAAPCPPLAAVKGDTPEVAPAVPFGCRFDPVLTRLFTPLAVPSDVFRIYAAEAPIEEVLAAFVARAGRPSEDMSRRQSDAPPPGMSWTIKAVDPVEAFGEAGVYDRTKVGRLYVGRRARVARGPIVEGGRTVASITLVSPYPNPSQTRLESGTMIIEFRIAGRQSSVDASRPVTACVIERASQAVY